jgi:DNA-binding MarR family transcriptional regulator
VGSVSRAGEDEGDERGALLDRIAAMQDALDTTALPSMLEPLMSMELTMQQLKVLVLLVSSDEGGTGQGLARALGISLASVSGLIDRLEGHGMVERVEDERDHRVRRVLVTPLGRKTVHRLVSAQSQLSRDPLEKLELGDLRALEQGMRAVLRVMGVPLEQ